MRHSSTRKSKKTKRVAEEGGGELEEMPKIDASSLHVNDRLDCMDCKA